MIFSGLRPASHGYKIQGSMPKLYRKFLITHDISLVALTWTYVGGPLASAQRFRFWAIAGSPYLQDWPRRIWIKLQLGIGISTAAMRPTKTLGPAGSEASELPRLEGAGSGASLEAGALVPA